MENPNKIKSSQAVHDADPGVISDDDDFAVNIISFNFYSKFCVVNTSMNISLAWRFIS